MAQDKSSDVTVFDTNSTLSHWPANIVHNSSEDTYTFSVSNSWNIQPLDHFHVVKIDEPQVGPGIPNVMNLNLPRQARLPYASRLYFFYVLEANEDDELVFTTVAGTGETINNLPSPHTIILTGSKELFICIGVGSNWIIHPFGSSVPTPIPTEVPVQIFTVNTATAPLQVSSPYQGIGVYPTTGNGYDFNVAAFTALPINVVTGMEGYLTPNSAIPTKTYVGFLCNTSGYYEIAPLLSMQCTAAGNMSSGSLTDAFFAPFYEFDATGTQVDYTPFVCSSVQWQSTGYYKTVCTSGSSVFLLTAGNFYAFNVTAYMALGAPTLTWKSTSKVVFKYLAPAPLAPLMFMAERTLMPAKSSSSIVSSSSPSSLSLKRNISFQGGNQQTSSRQPPSKKRARKSSDDGEKEIL